MLRYLVFAAFLQCCISQQYQQKVAPGVPPQNYQNYQQPPPPPPPQGHQQQVPQQQYQQQQYQPPPPQQQQYQQPPPPQQQQQQQQYQQQPQQGQILVQHDHHGEPQLLNAANIQHEREHIQEHMDVPIDTSKMSEQELQFHYFKMHDADNNNKLDGCELIKSLIHWHDGHEKKVTHMDDTELSLLTDMVLANNDYNGDGFIEYAEYKEGMKRTENRKELELKDGRVLTF
ncbi:nuclear transcription factor Y subunit beta isoform X1 [Leguminivora glycinivorella]|uniref:nuclear transcription factor Y subunit beta isoform X1 n=1 Tax=Leguminivora glycinivorella TaxID=1035111 RepID=UPI00200FF014|nr:nuclear transcription factor Y subunit beta isoform X1 [Leguminivora glycinivorella]XP_048003122.1 nuclear transcription factor Y subunit beta isoform X1 [Leguminivora glycinivorella]XP_048003124.1 nuclear transcription factor Y subunit beta isoform X1 [Leguminivora glycinivorella]